MACLFAISGELPKHNGNTVTGNWGGARAMPLRALLSDSKSTKGSTESLATSEIPKRLLAAS